MQLIDGHHIKILHEGFLIKALFQNHKTSAAGLL